jgi:hypothetical protein
MDRPRKIAMNTIVCQAGAMSGRLDEGEVRFAGVAIVSLLSTLLGLELLPMIVSRMMAHSRPKAIEKLVQGTDCERRHGRK